MLVAGVEDIELPVQEEVEGVDLSVGEGVVSWLSSSIFSFNLFMHLSCDFFASFLSFRIFCNFL